MTQKKAMFDMFLDAGLVLTFGLIFIQLLEKVDKLESKIGALESSDTWEKAELARLHRRQATLDDDICKIERERQPSKAPAKKAVSRPRKTTAAKKTAARKPVLA